MFNILFIFVIIILADRDCNPISKDNSALFPLTTYTESTNERNIIIPAIQWKTIPEFPDYLFNVNTLEIKSLKRVVPFRWFQKTVNERILKPRETSGGYYQFLLSNKNGVRPLQRSQIVWLVYNGNLPTRLYHIDHINNNPKDDRIENLQLLTVRENTTKGKLLTGREYPTGVYKHPNGKFYSKISIGCKTKHLGYHLTIEKAQTAYREALEKLCL